MVVYAAGVGPARLAPQAHRRRPDRRPAGQRPRPIALSILLAYFLKGVGGVRLDVSDGRCRPARRARPAQPALPAHPRSVGGVLLEADVRAARLAHHQRRQPGADGGVGDDRGPHARVARRRRLRRAAVLPRLAAGARRRHGRAARRLSAHAAGPARAADDPARAGGTRARDAPGGRGVHRPPHREGLWRRRRARPTRFGARDRAVLPHEPQDHERGRGACRRSWSSSAAWRPSRALWYGVKEISGGRADAGRVHDVPRAPRS